MEVNREEFLEYLDGIKENVFRQMGWDLPLNAEDFEHLTYIFWSEEENKRVMEIAKKAYLKSFNLTIADIAIFFPMIHLSIINCGYVSKRLVDEEIGYFVLDVIYRDEFYYEEERALARFRETDPGLVLRPTPFLLEKYWDGFTLVDVENALPVSDDSAFRRLMGTSTVDFHKWYVEQDRYRILEESGWIAGAYPPEELNYPESISFVLKNKIDLSWDKFTGKDALEEAYKKIRAKPEKLLEPEKLLDERLYNIHSKRLKKGFERYLRKW